MTVLWVAVGSVLFAAAVGAAVGLAVDVVVRVVQAWNRKGGRP